MEIDDEDDEDDEDDDDTVNVDDENKNEQWLVP